VGVLKVVSEYWMAEKRTRPCVWAWVGMMMMGILIEEVMGEEDGE
jgi:hypothetical protein